MSTIRSPFKATRRNSRVVPRPCTLETAKAAEHDKQLGSGAIDHPEAAARLLCHRRASKIPLTSKTAVPCETNGASIACTVHGGSPEPPYTKQTGSGTTTTPKALLAARRSCHCRPSETTGPSETKGHSQRTRCVHSHKLVPSLPVFTPFLPRSAPFLPHFYPVFTPVLPQFYPVFTLFLPRSAPSFLPPFYPVFTPLVKGKMPNLPRFYPVFTPPPVFTLSTVLPPFYPVPSTLRMPIPPFLPQG